MKLIICNVDNNEVKKVDTSDQLSKNFKIREFRSRQSEVVLYSQRLVNVLQAVRDHYGNPLSLSNAHRTLSHNSDVGGSIDSDHIYGKAADIYMWGVDAEELKKVVSKIAGHYSNIVTYHNTNHVHIGLVEGEHKRLYSNGSRYINRNF